MKLFQTFRVALVGSVGAGVIGLLLPSATLADGKGASKLMNNSMSTASQSQKLASTAASMGCPLCKDIFLKMPDTSAKGMRLGAVKNTLMHQCPACATTITTVGSGKAKTDRVSHTCSNSGGPTASCCLATK